ncbi:DUF4175 domain-containing protein [Parvularcula dongshanensis]|uniref:Uncharacterized protein (TIGR02302 family) n=1 Tax=Parvularcula dongshanensis TaxID=1173995 RepID=A0A840I302_9PROT|nr:DUF4175 family protein [Parvularcula dongshanensis]MBB4658594.1 uncharacterized protein (TIGR02302 family) [Parvularcula dongshanensis]
MNEPVRAPRPPILRAKAVLLWERAQQAFLPPVLLLLAGAAVALLGLYEIMPWWAETGLKVAFLLAFAALVIRGLLSWRAPGWTEAARRIEADSDLAPGTINALRDSPFAGTADDPYWRAYQDRLQRLLAGTRLRRPRARTDGTDRLGLRFGLALLIVAGLILAGPDAPSRLRSAFVPGLGSAGPVMADVWLDPPAYTNRPPVLLVQSAELPDGIGGQIEVPQGTSVKLRLAGSGKGPRAKVTLATAGGRERLRGQRGEGAFTAEAALDENAALTVRAGGSVASWPIVVTRDAEPRVTLLEPPAEEGGTRIALEVLTADDYGIQDASILLRLQPAQDLPPDVPGPDQSVLAGEETLPLPALAGPGGERAVTLDLSEHPWAGLAVALVIEVKDGAGHAARTKPVALTLPTRSFYNPLAKTVIEERRKLAATPSSWPRTARLLDALTLAPEKTAESTREYLLLRTAYHDVWDGRGEAVEEVVESFWPLAVALEDEGLTLARQRLEAAQQALRQALADGASQDEIERLIEELRQAMNDYIQALAQSGDAFAESSGESLGEQDLDDLLDAMRDASDRGAEAEAEALLSQLEQMLENLSLSRSGEGQEGEGQQAGQGQGQGGGSGQGGGGSSGGGSGPLDQAGDLIDRQRRLSDETFSARRGERGTEGLAGDQRGLGEALEALREGADESAAQALTDAGRAMEGAAQALERGDLGTAQALQEAAIESIAEGAERIAEAEGDDGSGERRDQTGDGRSQRAGDGGGRDPLGRPYGPQGQTGVEIPDLSDPERVREVIDILRRRVADPALPSEEREYLERLLERF